MSGTMNDLLNLLDARIGRIDHDISAWQHCKLLREQHLAAKQAEIVAPQAQQLLKAQEAVKLAQQLLAEAEAAEVEAKAAKAKADATFKALQDATWKRDDDILAANLQCLTAQRAELLKELNSLLQRTNEPIDPDAALAGGFSLVDGAKLPKKGSGK